MTAKQNVNDMSRAQLTKHYNAMEIPETFSADYDTQHLRELLVTNAPDMFEDMKSGGKVSRKRGGTVSRKSGGKIMQGYKAGGRV